MPHRLFRRAGIGRRGTALVILGVLWAVYGWTLFSVSRPPLADGWLWHEAIPQPWRAGLWLVSGLAAVVYARRRQGADVPGFVALVLMPLIRLGSFTCAGVVYALSGGDAGYKLGLPNALIWAAVVALIMLIAGWDEPETLSRDSLNRARRGRP